MKRKFPPGIEWLYLKIYTGIKTADLVLEEIIQPLVAYFQQKEYISKWFFIRYNDPKPHLRVRLLLNNINYYNEILEKINHAFEQIIDSGEISHILIDTYNREIERYGKNTMEDAESLFHKNSEFTLQCLHFDDEEKASKMIKKAKTQESKSSPTTSLISMILKVLILHPLLQTMPERFAASYGE